MFQLYHKLSSDYKVTSRILLPNDRCYCGSEKKYFSCHATQNKRKKLNVIIIKKKNTKTNKVKTKFKFEAVLTKNTFKPGDINPLNKDGQYTNIDIDVSAGVDQ